MSNSKSFFVLKAKAIPVRYGLSRNIQTLLQGLDSYHSGSVDDSELGRLVRLSPRRRAAVANTITKCANILKKDPSEVKTCVDIIEMCTEILDIADRQTSTEYFPFMKLPMEIRERTMDLMIDDTFRSQTIVPATKAAACRCPKYDRDHVFQTSQMKSVPNLLGKALGEEFYRSFFRKKRFRFRCACELLVHLTNNAHLREHVRHIVVHWCGPKAAEAFSAIPKCLRLEALSINLSKSTLMHLNERAEMMRTYFPIAYRNVRMSDILGIDELLDIRGLREVNVFHIQPKSTSHSVEMDRACLWEMLTRRLTLPQAVNHALNDGLRRFED
ncbi:hypothetical protein E4U17_000737 [Claviceps sp. LM77 group G4]|nr:hypothetical protein E4U17_000737 [Claviceps sp. LM77 group G4]KAG6082879.1 hypothetical protein E4U16_005312 [Claviceps sp. LM84 group G4]KAG6085294.1 hypothetical protein E4U33_002085 [Claviceps sp. LM78 group G4]